MNSNPSMCRLLGANLDVFSPDFKPCIEIDGHQIHIIYDSSHLIKLNRNILAEHEVLYDIDKNSIKWDYIEKLVNAKDNFDFSLTHKLNKTHLDWKNNMM